jgi:phenylalanyl-tRNA synthetase alpha chain
MSSPRPPATLTPDAVAHALAVRDLTDPDGGPHAMQLLLDALHRALAARWRCAVRVHRASPVVSVEDNYDRLRYPPGGAARDARYTRYVTASTLLRTQTSAMIPPLLRALAAEAAPPPDVLLVCPGLVYRRDTIDRLHTGEPHQADLWRVARARLDAADLHEMIATVVAAALPGVRTRAVPAEHPYTLDGRQVDVLTPDGWVEVGECGLAHPEVLADAGLDPRSHSGLAMGLGLDRLLMLAKGVDDIRLLRSADPRVAAQMLDLAPYRPVSDQPPIRRDLSLAVAGDATAEELGDRVRTALGEHADRVEAVEVVAETPGAALPAAAAARLGLRPGQKNVLVRLTIRDLTRTLTHAEANALRDRVYAALHEGAVWTWATKGA